MSLDLDTAQPIRSHSRRLELVRAIVDAPPSGHEMTWLEWKSQVDVGGSRWRAELARQILGMANRDPEAAMRWARGCGFVVVGASPGELCGTRFYDIPKIEAWLTPYVGASPRGPQWEATFVQLDGKDVLILTVEPPEPGHPLWPCRRDFDPPRGDDAKGAIREGRIYVRHQGYTREATAADIEMLSRRAAGGARRLAGISLAVAPGGRGVVLDPHDPAPIAEWERRERDALKLPPPPEPAPRRPTTPPDQVPAGLAETARRITELVSVEKGLLGQVIPRQTWDQERRTREAYQAEVEKHVAKTCDILPVYFVSRVCRRKRGLISVLVRNETPDPIQQLRVELLIEAERVSGIDEADVFGVSLPARPVPYGQNTISGAFATAYGAPRFHSYLSHPVAVGRGLKIDNRHSVHVTFDPIELWPEDEAELGAFYLVAMPEHAGATLHATWTARAKNVSGVMKGSLEIEVDPRLPTIDELLANDEPEDE